MTTATKYRGLLFAPEMARAVWENRKTQTRRVVKLRDKTGTYSVFDDDGWPSSMDDAGDWHRDEPPHPPGSIVYVKERWARSLNKVLFAADCPTGEGPRDNTDDWDWNPVTPNRWKSSLHMRMRDARTWLRITNVRVERVQDISEADALAEGFGAETCEAFFLDAAGKIVPEDGYYLRFDDGTDSQEHLCRACAERELAKAKKPGRLCCEHCPETDGPAYCEECQQPLLMSLTAYGIERELFLESCPGDAPHDDLEHFAATGVDAAIASMIAGGLGDLRKEHLGRLAQIGFATCIDLMNGAGTWKSNPWVWVYTFERVERPEGI